MSTCICPLRCDCQSPDTNPALVSDNCPVHNFRPDPYPDCPAEVHRNGAAWDDYGFHCAPAQPNPKKEQHDK